LPAAWRLGAANAAVTATAATTTAARAIAHLRICIEVPFAFGLTDGPIARAPPSRYRGYAAVTPPSTLTTFPVDLLALGPAKNAIVSATSSGRTATPSFVRPW